MDPVSLVVTAVALGASAGLKDTAAAVVKDAYAALKALLGRRKVEVVGVERHPGSESQQGALRENLEDLDSTADAVDEELLAAARQVVDVVAAHDQAAGLAMGVDLHDVQAEFLRIRSVRSTSTGVKVDQGRFIGGIDIGEVSAGQPSGSGSGGPSGR